jgi:hypothetical protein
MPSFFTRCSWARPITRPRLLFFCSLLADSLTMRYNYNERYFTWGLFELFPPIYLPYSITLNGLSSPPSGSRSQPSNIKGLPTSMLVQSTASRLNILKIKLHSNSKWKTRAAPLFSFECTRWRGWLADMERCFCIILRSCKIHELLLMIFPSQLLKSS